MPYRSWVEVSRGQIAANFRAIRDVVGADVEVMPVVKADAYRHGAVEVSRTLEAEGATSLFIYGSRARGDNRADSDVDVLVDFDEAKKFSLFNLAGIKLAIERKLGIEAHVTTRDSLYASIRPDVEKQSVRIF